MATGYGACIATDHIVVDGRRVGFMYREEPGEAPDCGWSFMSGDETQEYMDDARNLAFYDVNTIANYDPEIIPFLDSPIGAAFEREDATSRFVAVDFESSE